MPDLVVINRSWNTVNWHDVHPMQLWHHAIYTGGALPAAASAVERSLMRVSMGFAVRASVIDVAGDWMASHLYHDIEQSEKSALSYRIGTCLAGLAGELELDIGPLVHRQSLFGASSGTRGDLLGRRFTTNTWHGVEAKGRSPRWPTGGYRSISAEFDEAKDQAESLGQDLQTYGVPSGPDHWACVGRTSTFGVTEVHLEDPPMEPVGGDPGGPAVGDADLAFGDPEERLLQSYYQVVGDIAELASRRDATRADGRFRDGGDYLAVQVPGTGVFLAAHRALVQARAEGRLASLVTELFAGLEGRYQPNLGVSRTGLGIYLPDVPEIDAPRR